MCSGVATALAFASHNNEGKRSPELLRAIASNVGRITSYAAAGAIAGALGIAAFSWLDATLANLTLRWLAAILLSVVGLSLAGIMPTFVLSYPSRILASLLKPEVCARSVGPTYVTSFFAGVAWGFMPCAMAYSALFYATISGSAARGLLTMAGFGAATFAPLLLPSLGMSAMTRRILGSRTRTAFGLVLAAIGFAGTFNAVYDFGVWCRAA
jgi:sulfite exporter TauE/SafE